MTGTVIPTPTPRRGRDESAERGRLTFSGTTVERIAAQAVTEVDGVGGSATRMLGLAVGADDSAKVSARVSDSTASLDVRMSVSYPTSVRVTTANARAHLIRRIEELTGLAVPRVDIAVTAMHSDAGEVGRVQ